MVTTRQSACPDAIDRVVERYASLRPRYEELADRICALLRELLGSSDVKYDAITGRAKTVESFRGKITRPGRQYLDPLSDVTDLAGVRVVLYYLDDVRAVCDLVESEFSVDAQSSVDKGNLLMPQEFGYLSVHYVVSLSTARAQLPEWYALADMKAEIQIRTVLQHAWAAISHALQYKREQDIPLASRRRLLRLSGLLELADEEFLALRDERLETISATAQRIRAGDLDLRLDLLSVEEYCSNSDLVREIVRGAAGAGFKIAPDRHYCSLLITYCRDFAITRLGQLDEELRRSMRGWRPYLQKHMHHVRQTLGFSSWHVSPAFLLILLLLRARRHHVTLDYLVESKGWHSDDARFFVRLLDRES